MRYTELLQKARESTIEKAAHQRKRFVIVFFRELGFYITPIFLFMNVTANKITTLGLILGLVAAALIWNQNVIMGIVVYFIVVLLDHVDGTVSRIKGEATFYGRFIDGFFGIVIESSLKLSLSALVAQKNGLDIIVWSGIVSSVLTPLHHLFYDRYSTFVRWIKEEGHTLKTKPYIRPSMSGLFNTLSDAQSILIFSLPVYFLSDYWEWIILIYFLLNIYLALYTLIYYTKSAYVYFRINAKPHR